MLPRKSKLIYRVFFSIIICLPIFWYFDVYSWLLYDADEDKLSNMDMPQLMELYYTLRSEKIKVTCPVNKTLIDKHYLNNLRKCLLIMIRQRDKNPHPFHYIMNPRYACESENIFLLIYVHSAPDHEKRRMLIRETWGRTNGEVILVFLMGMPQSLALQKALVFENDLYGDIVQENFVDSYRNLTYKAIMGLRWTCEFCQRSKFVLKSDDDVFVDIFAVLRHLHRLQSIEGIQVKGQHQVTGLLQCMVWHRMKVMRDRASKWFVPVEDYSAPFFPTYCSGLAFLASTDVVTRMSAASRRVKFFWVDDVFVTGTLASVIGVKHRSIGKIRGEAYSLKAREFSSAFSNTSRSGTLFFGHVHDETQFIDAWRLLVARENRTR